MAIGSFFLRDHCCHTCMWTMWLMRDRVLLEAFQIPLQKLAYRTSNKMVVTAAAVATTTAADFFLSVELKW